MTQGKRSIMHMLALQNVVEIYLRPRPLELSCRRIVRADGLKLAEPEVCVAGTDLDVEHARGGG